MKLTEKEIKLLKALVEKGPLTGYQVFRKNKLNLMSNAHWKTTRESLLSKKLIGEVESKGRGKPYWLTGDGILAALAEGADPEKTRQQVKLLVSEKASDTALLGCDLAEYDFETYKAYMDILNSLDNGKLKIGKLLEMGPRFIEFATYMIGRPQAKEMMKSDSRMSTILNEFEKSGDKIRDIVKKLRGGQTIE